MKIMMNAVDTLKSFNMTPEEFYSKLTVGNRCSGLSAPINCSNIVTCPDCPIHFGRTDTEIRYWL